MAKKRKKAKRKNGEFSSDPFSNLKGFAVSMEDKGEEKPTQQKPHPREEVGSFADEMEMLGVKKLNLDSEASDELPDDYLGIGSSIQIEDPTDEEIFLSAMGELQVNFKDSVSADNAPLIAEPRRLKQLKRGKLIPDASLDLHGCLRSEAVQKVIHFLADSQHQGWKTVLVITGKGTHSEEGTPILRDEIERYLSDKGKNYVVEWGRAPKQYGGAGALILFLRHKSE
ncbi:MAG: Smr/MutS family protein [Desulfuromusa sp.]|nr:Smr/MutS family protein [Desulfuromusa sp.]